MNNSAMNILACLLAYISAETQPMSEVAETENIHAFILGKLAGEFSKMSVPIYTFTSSVNAENPC